jgi:pimeloyl-ACP methyl ester carboxylesterase
LFQYREAVLDGGGGSSAVVLVEHSYGGMVITDAAAGYGNVVHLVYITSVMPEQ